MPVLPNPRHEKFAEALAEGKPASSAYETAGYRPNGGGGELYFSFTRVAAQPAVACNTGSLRGRTFVQVPWG
jgi:phage terminase small subunit